MRHLALAAITLCALACAANAAAASPYALPDGVVALVDDRPITLAQYEHWFAIAAKAGGRSLASDPPRFTRCIADKQRTLPRRSRTTRRQLRRQCAAEHRALLEQVMQLLISFRWIRGEAAERGITVTPAEVRAQFREQKRASFPKRRDYVRFLRESGQKEADILFRVELDILSNRIREEVHTDVPPVSEEDVARYYDDNRGRFTVPARRDVLVVMTKTRSEAAVARARIEAGERWAAVAKDLSIDPASRKRGGRLRNVASHRSVRAFFAAARGRLRGPVRTRFGWYVFKVTRIRPSERLPLRKARSTIRQLLRSQREQEALDVFVRDFNARWKARTVCRRGYRTEDCAAS